MVYTFEELKKRLNLLYTDKILKINISYHYIKNINYLNCEVFILYKLNLIRFMASYKFNDVLTLKLIYGNKNDYINIYNFLFKKNLHLIINTNKYVNICDILINLQIEKNDENIIILLKSICTYSYNKKNEMSQRNIFSLLKLLNTDNNIYIGYILLSLYYIISYKEINSRKIYINSLKKYKTKIKEYIDYSDKHIDDCINEQEFINFYINQRVIRLLASINLY